MPFFHKCVYSWFVFRFFTYHAIFRRDPDSAIFVYIVLDVDRLHEFPAQTLLFFFFALHTWSLSTFPAQDTTKKLPRFMARGR